MRRAALLLVLAAAAGCKVNPYHPAPLERELEAREAELFELRRAELYERYAPRGHAEPAMARELDDWRATLVHVSPELLHDMYNHCAYKAVRLDDRIRDLESLRQGPYEDILELKIKLGVEVIKLQELEALIGE